MRMRSIYPLLLVPLLVATMLVAVLRFYVFPATHATHAASIPGRVKLPDSVSVYTSKSQLMAQVPGSQPIQLAIGLSLQNQSDLATYLAQVSLPQSALYHHYLTPETFNALYAPTPTSEAIVSNFLRAQGFHISNTYANHLLIDISGTVAQAEQAFQVQMNTYQSVNGHVFFANDRSPSLPASVAALVTSISGLDSLVQYGRNPLAPGAPTPKLAQTAGSPIMCPQAGAPTTPTSYTPYQIASAYNFTPLYNAGNLGEGQTVGLLELDGFSSNDIALYASCFGGKNTQVNRITIDGYNGAAGANAAEVELDMEMVLGLAPRLAALNVYEASGTSLAAYNDAWARIIADKVPVVSTSWVFCEQGAGLSSEIQQENIFFQAAAAQGQTILAASGDLGATGCYDPQTGANTTPSVDDPASQPYVTGVGGTTLHINADNTYGSEQVWNDRTLKNGASGGGVSHVWFMPKWQQGPGVANAYSNGYREVPDVAVNADPQTGYDVYCSVGGCFGGGWRVIGGTSAAAPVWAALIALVNEASAKAKQYQMGFLNPALYAINHGAPGTSYAAAFHDIVPIPGAINNNDYVGNSGTYPDGSMYDMATGLGSFDAYNLTQNLLTLGQNTQPLTTPTSTVWYFAEGYAGSSFQEFLTIENPDPTRTAQVQVQYLLENSGTGPKILHTVLPKSRGTFSANNDLHYPYTGPGHALSMIVTSLNGVGIVAERPMYFSFHGINSGTDTLGATKLGQDFYFADVESQRNYSSFITILNPPGGQTAQVTLDYYAGGTLIGTQTLPVLAGQRGTISPAQGNITRNSALHVHSDQPVVVERPTYFSTSRANISGPVTGAMTVVGAQAPGTDWLFAEGYTGVNFHEYLILANFDASLTATATVNLEYGNGAVNPVSVTIPPQSQYVFDVNNASAVFAQTIASTDTVSAEVTSDNPIVAQRVEYFRFNGVVPGGSDVIGAQGPAKASYSFAEGYTAPGFSEFLTLQNPNTTAEDVAITMYLSHSIISQKIVHVGPQSRVTVSINGVVVPLALATPAAGYEVSLLVQALNGTIVAERPMYFSWHGVDQGGSDVVGFTG